MITNKEFEKLYSRLNPAQKHAVDAIEGAVMVIAGPGTGKTQILTLRIANILLNTQVNPENILALTFTESAVYEMRKRLVSIIGTPGYRVEINTFHGFCNEIIQNNSENFAHLIAAESITELQQIQILESIIRDANLTVLKPIGDPNYYVRPALSAINDLKKEGVTAGMFEKALQLQESDYGKIEDLHHEKGVHQGKIKTKYQDLQKNINKNKELLIIYKAYQQELYSKKMYDFNDMLLEVIKAFENDPQLLLKFQEQYQYFLVDEHQDTNAAQNKIIESLAGYFPNPNLFVVGDEKQAIFRFQGASLENFLYFKHLYKEALLINLQTNYRSSQRILDAAGSLISHNQKTKELLPSESKLVANFCETNLGIKIASFHDYYSEFYWLGEHIKKRINNKADPCEIAVLVRNNRDVEPIIDVFEQKSIPYIVESDQNILQDLEIQKVILLLECVHNLGNDATLLRAMHIDSLQIYPLDIYKLMQYSKENHTSVWDTLSSDSFETALELKSLQKIKEFVQKMNTWKTKSMNESFDTVFV
ncbi:MAG TPA: ATP-dependent helicase, partial [Candidatus Nitrosocosmicus sp.]|nr:ATP-dependent helicase [Candidatus Nitrosocosmicus sp.]